MISFQRNYLRSETTCWGRCGCKMDCSASLLRCQEGGDLLDHVLLAKLLLYASEEGVEEHPLGDVTLLRCQLNEAFGVGDVSTCAHAEVGQMLLNMIRLGVRTQSCFEQSSKCACSLAWDKVLDLVEVVSHCWSQQGLHHPAQLQSFLCAICVKDCLDLMEPETWLLHSVVLGSLGLMGLE